jgi:hypothetical protein
MRRAFLLLAVLTTPMWLGCSPYRTVPRVDVTAARPDSPDKFKRFATPKGQKIVGYTTTDGRYHKLRGTARLEGDVIVFHNQNVWHEATTRVPVADLESVRSEYYSPVMLACTVVVIVGGLYALMVAAVAPAGW